MSVVGGIIGGNAAEEQAQQQHEQAQQQQAWANFKGQLQTDQVNRQKAQANVAKRYRNELIAKNANYVRAMSELDLKDKSNIAFANASNAHRVNRTNTIARSISRGIGRGGTQAALQRMLRSRNAKDIMSIAEQERRAQKQIEAQQKATLAQRNFTSDEASVFIGGAPPVYQGGSGQTMAAAFQGAQAGLSMVSALSKLGGGTTTQDPTTADGNIIGAADTSGAVDAGLSGGTSVTGSVGGYGQIGSFA